jgi:hypothetical protein
VVAVGCCRHSVAELVAIPVSNCKAIAFALELAFPLALAFAVSVTEPFAFTNSGQRVHLH